MPVLERMAIGSGASRTLVTSARPALLESMFPSLAPTRGPMVVLPIGGLTRNRHPKQMVKRALLRSGISNLYRPVGTGRRRICDLI